MRQWSSMLFMCVYVCVCLATLNAILDSGQGILFNGLVIHGSKPNPTNKRRCGIVYRFTINGFHYMDDNIKLLANNIKYTPIPIRLIDKCNEILNLNHIEL